MAPFRPKTNLWTGSCPNSRSRSRTPLDAPRVSDGLIFLGHQLVLLDLPNKRRAAVVIGTPRIETLRQVRRRLIYPWETETPISDAIFISVGRVSENAVGNIFSDLDRLPSKVGRAWGGVPKGDGERHPVRRRVSVRVADGIVSDLDASQQLRDILHETGGTSSVPRGRIGTRPRRSR